VSRLLKCYAERHYAECSYAGCHYAECGYAECHYAECGYAGCHFAECGYAECHHAECGYAGGCHYVECGYAECHYAECGYAGCHFAECGYAGCHVTEHPVLKNSSGYFKEFEKNLKQFFTDFSNCLPTFISGKHCNSYFNQKEAFFYGVKTFLWMCDPSRPCPCLNNAGMHFKIMKIALFYHRTLHYLASTS
jgi:hypothetical protein